MSYHSYPPRRRPILKWLLVICVLVVGVTGIAGGLLWRQYQTNLRPVSTTSTVVSITIEPGSSLSTIARTLEQKQLIRSARAFEIYARLHDVSSKIQAGSYDVSPAQSVQAIVQLLTHGKVATSLVTILPGQRLDQIRSALINQGFSEADVAAALDPAQYAALPIFSGKPAGTNLEGYVYPDSFQKTATTSAKDIVAASLREMATHVTADIVKGFQRQGLTTYQGIVIASIVEQEVTNQADRAQAAQVFIKRLKIGMPLGSDVTAYYGSRLAGMGKDVTYDSPYNTRLHTGLPPTPISNVSVSSLRAVAEPSTTDWLFFVTGDNGTTYFSKTVEEHEALAAKYCHVLCQE